MHAAALFLVLQSAFSPQGDGEHGSIDSVTLGGTKQRNFLCFLKLLRLSKQIKILINLNIFEIH